MPYTYDSIVVGLGAWGSAAAYHLAERGHRVLGLDMHREGHAAGSSHGDHRMIRRSTSGPPAVRDALEPLLARSWELWRSTEELSGVPLIRLLGELWLGTIDGAKARGVTPADISADSHRDVVGSDELGDRFPGVRIADDMFATFEPGAGVLSPSTAVSTVLALARARGAHLQRRERMVGWRALSSGVEVTTSAATYQAGHLVLACGAWSSRALLMDAHEVPLRVLRVVNANFRPRSSVWTMDAGAPNVLLSVPEGSFYASPADGSVGFRIGRHGGTPVDPESRRDPATDTDIEALREVLDRYLPGAAGALADTTTCLYTMAPDELFLVDRSERSSAVVYAAGGSGIGFKFAPAVGELIADLVTDRRPSIDVTPFARSRFGTGAA